ncbi:hypothetical protein [Microbacterium sp. ABRD28]|uniref:hypothetical protein n=1 Tax=Microbacterium sp. ABRD28 TaxID=2268461 RepID=UPI000F54D448|nr:hypothetical protein [Microbacterium sp. ABRD28]AZC14570.1 hypothetical protein DT073_13390 [Microbacterium sp. ABRD28]
MFYAGMTVRLPDGQFGKIVKPATGPGNGVWREYQGEDQTDLTPIIAVLSENGELRHFSEQALRDAGNDPIRRSGTLDR